MNWFTTHDLTEFPAEADAWLRSRPTENALLLTVANDLRVRGSGAYGDAAPLYGWWRSPAGAVESAPRPGASVRTRSDGRR